MIHLYYLPACGGVLVVLLVILCLVIHRVRHGVRSISRLPGPTPGSWLVGNLPEMLRAENATDAERAWIDTYGTAVKIKGALGLDILLTADPKALQYILNTAGPHFPKPQQNIVTAKLTTGEGLVWAQGAQHTRHRKIMNPAFSYASLRVFLPLFRHTAQRAVLKWKELIAHRGTGSTVLDIPSWLARTTLDAMGAAAFDYDFGALDGVDSELSNVYKNLFADSFFHRSDFTIVFEALWGYLPPALVDLIQMIPTKQLQRLRKYMTVARQVAKNILEKQTQSHYVGKEGGKDVMSLLIRANLSENPKTRLGDKEIMAQLTTLMLAGHETTASSVTWALYELSRHPEYQIRVREEIIAARAKAVAQREDGEIGVQDLESMKYLVALMKETLRCHPILPLLYREAGCDEFIPLHMPITTKTGEVISCIPVSKGQRIMLSLATYNRLKSLWGDDADMWRPERFIEGLNAKQSTCLGVISNISTFGSGFRSCIGWRFALLEMQAILIELIENFEFSPAPGDPEILRSATGGVVFPMLKGSPGRAQLPLTVTPILC
ncbi:cytochrome P450 [Ramaria rubella]|nr:cytochrome P450 [Ramaria rubella]